MDSQKPDKLKLKIKHVSLPMWTLIWFVKRKDLIYKYSISNILAIIIQYINFN